ncbi:Serine aminopeptidase, S33 [Lishizhenia tianjinensis]|uniref:Serine aminopeptidase, S33 n=1 Tax=Lishizhenia tianjinensis TaxID=477690 RepID=A0A1I6YY95_9FLAO|nr:alpha/beta hydrolase [Lishizhenia tianjinensis]SFT55298.1 Serine aminopeptidase, S33 [Lishizhenia tianjinensis]
MIKLIKFYLQFLQIFSSRLAGKKAFDIFQITNRKTIREREKNFYDAFQTIILEDEKESFPVITNNLDSDQKVVLVHGWNSNLAALQEVANALNNAGIRFYAFNLPAHGKSKLSKTNLYASKERFKRVVECIDDKSNLSFVAHSFGSAVTAYGLSEMQVNAKHLVFLTVPESIEMMFSELAGLFGLNDKTLDQVYAEATKLVKEDVKEITVQRKLEKVDYNKALFIHDKFDKVIPFDNSERVHASAHDSKLIAFENIGHYRMLTNPEVLRATMDFVLEPVEAEIVE